MAVKMASWTRLLAAAALSIAAVSADTGSTQIYPMSAVSDNQSDSRMIVEITSGSGSIPPISYYVVPLTYNMGLDQSSTIRSSVNIQGQLVWASVSSYANITSNEIAYLCCDSMNTSFTDQNRMLSTVMGNNPKAILLYSQTGSCCGISSTTNLPYQYLLSMVDAKDAAQTLNITNAGGTAFATITGNGTSSNDGSQNSQSNNNSAIAMSILYSITGLITLLFLVIIATGAIRAHRHPERYGPRSGYGGRPRQSRARGIARAVLETIPIVKFGDPTPAKPDPNMELESGPNSHPGVTRDANAAAAATAAVSATAGSQTDVQAHHLSTIPEDAEARPKSAANGGGASAAAGEPKSGIGAASSVPSGEGSGTGVDDEHLGCSICTEDFTVGEDVRVLPCNHKFHPKCVDPWLIDVSGTCPLCRLDLHPNDGEGPEVADSDEAHLPPPLDSDDASAAAADTAAGNPHRRRSSRFFDLNRLRHASVEERIEVLRRYRTENQAEHNHSEHHVEAAAAAAAAADGEDEHSRSAKLTRRLRDKFRIRTRTQSPSAPNQDGSRPPSS